jgi:hypothetical protein|tara:strand:+ start:1276 stop:1851 length:576 start_codon:yes stop_codon:yes gene_type:complete
MASIVPISSLPTVTSTDGTEVLPIVQSQTTKQIELSAITSLNQRKLTLTGFVNDLASQSDTPGYDYMEWTSNSTGDASVPAIRMVENLKLVKVAYVWLGDSPLLIDVGEKIDFTLRKLTSGARSIIENYTSMGALFTIARSDNNTNPQATVTLASPITIAEGDMLAVIGAETGVITPTTGELAITFLFEIV